MNYKAKLKEIQTLSKAVEDEAIKFLDLHFKNPKLNLVIGSWDCTKSIIGVCVYDLNEDCACDFCLFCNHPDERK